MEEGELEVFDGELCPTCGEGILEVWGWRELKDAPLNTDVLLAWGSNASGPMGHTIARNTNGVWQDHQGVLSKDGYRAFAWIPLPELPAHVDEAGGND